MTTTWRLLAALLLLPALLAPAVVAADEEPETIPLEWRTVASNYPTTTSTGNYICEGDTDGSPGARRAVIEVDTADLTDPGNVASAFLQIEFYDGDPEWLGSQIKLYLLESAETLTTVTWNNLPDQTGGALGSYDIEDTDNLPLTFTYNVTDAVADAGATEDTVWFVLRYPIEEYFDDYERAYFTYSGADAVRLDVYYLEGLTTPSVTAAGETQTLDHDATVSAYVADDGGAAVQLQFQHRVNGVGDWTIGYWSAEGYTTGQTYTKQLHDLDEETTYEYQVRARHFGSETPTAWSASDTFTTDVDASVTPTEPTGPVACAITTHRIIDTEIEVSATITDDGEGTLVCGFITWFVDPTTHTEWQGASRWYDSYAVPRLEHEEGYTWTTRYDLPDAGEYMKICAWVDHGTVPTEDHYTESDPIYVASNGLIVADPFSTGDAALALADPRIHDGVYLGAAVITEDNREDWNGSVTVQWCDDKRTWDNTSTTLLPGTFRRGDLLLGPVYEYPDEQPETVTWYRYQFILTGTLGRTVYSEWSEPIDPWARYSMGPGLSMLPTLENIGDWMTTTRTSVDTHIPGGMWSPLVLLMALLTFVFRKWKVLAIAMPLAAMGMFIAAGWIATWLVVILALLGGLITFAWVRRTTGG